jgi:hypothetical protein
LGNDSVLALSTSRVTIGGTNPYVGLLTIYGSASLSAGFGLRNSAGTAAGSFSTYAAGSGGGSTDISIGSAGFLEMNTAGVERMRITSTGNVGIGTSSPTAVLHLEKASQDNVLAVVGQDTYEGALFLSSAGSGKDANIVIGNSRSLIFYSTANSTPAARGTRILTIDSQGIKFGTDTAAANALDDYEEGTFTPTIAGSTTAGTATYTTQLARYTKIGRQVSCQIDLGYNSGTGTGNLTIAGLPFTDAGLNNPAVTIGYLDGITLTANNYALAYLASGTTRIDFVQIPTGGGSLTSVSYDSEGRIILNVTYTA